MFIKKYVLNNYMLGQFAKDVEQRIADAKEKGEKLGNNIFIRELPKDGFKVIADYFHDPEMKEFEVSSFTFNVVVSKEGGTEDYAEMIGAKRYNLTNEWIGEVSIVITVTTEDIKNAVISSTDRPIEDIDSEMARVVLRGFRIYENNHKISTLSFIPESFNVQKKFETITQLITTDGEKVKLILPEEIKMVKTALESCKNAIWSGDKQN